MSGIRAEFMVFAAAVLSGAVIRVVYRCLSCLRMNVAHHPAVIALEDFCYWTGTAIYLFVQMYHTSNGSIRWYFVLGVVIGAIFASFLVKIIEKICLKIPNKTVAKQKEKR